ncbi:MAG TPA: glycoside hydrolase family 20 zincin-like fold domain-containing protein [Chthoniobacteraceae bacterium]|nr:glycoside hydrolase family 20 zincin-like fold domain-containing protein [Chthoniobacteraceae bacterium]
MMNPVLRLLLICLAWSLLSASGRADRPSPLLPLFDFRTQGATDPWSINIYKDHSQGGRGEARFQSEEDADRGRIGRLTSSSAGKFNLISPEFAVSPEESPIGFRIEYRTGEHSSDLALILCDVDNHIYSTPLPPTGGKWKIHTFTRFPNFAKNTPPLNLGNVRKLYFRGSDSVDLSLAALFLVNGEREIPLTFHSRPIVVPTPAAEAPQLDGVPDEAAWHKATLLPALSVSTGPLKKEAFPTEVRALRVGGRLYLGAKLGGEPAPVRQQTLPDHDIWKDSSLEVYLQSENGERSTWQLIVNADNVRQDYRNSDVTWNGPWKSAVRVNPKGWTVEMEIDLAGFDPDWNDASLWRWNIVRNVVVPDLPVKHHIGLRAGLSGTNNLLNSQSALLAFKPTVETPDPDDFSLIKTAANHYSLLVPASATRHEETKKGGHLFRVSDERSDVLLASLHTTPGSSVVPFQIGENGALRVDFRESNTRWNQVALLEFLASNPTQTRWDDIILWPKPQKLEIGSESLSLLQITEIKQHGKGDRFPADHLREEISRRYGWPAAGNLPGGLPITLFYDADAGIREEGYRLTVDAGGVAIRASSGRGMYYGVRTLLDLIEESSRDFDVPHIRHVQCDDWPQTPKRILYYYLNASRYDIPTSVDAVKRYLYKEVAGGRYNLLFLMMGNGYHYAAAPRLRARHGWSRAELQEIVDYARRHYVEPAPASEFPGHAEWMLNFYPGFGEKGGRGTFDLTQPGVIPTLLACYDELLEIFRPRYFHIGGDEYRPNWTPEGPSAEKRRALLLDQWKQLHAHLSSRNVRMVMFDDMLSPKWNGGPPLEAARLLKDLPRDIIFHTWTDRGIENHPSVYRKLGFEEVWKVTTSFDPQRADRSLGWWQDYDGLGLALFVPWPWSSFAHYNYHTHVKYTSAALHLNALLLWHPRALAQGANHVIENEGRHWMRVQSPPRLGRTGLQPNPLTPDIGSPAPPLLKAALAGFTADTIGEPPYRFRTNPDRVPIATFPNAPVTVPVNRRADGISFLHTTAVEEKKLPELYHAFRSTNRNPHGLEIGSYRVRFENGTVESVPIVLGYNIHFFNAPMVARIMGGSPTFFTGVPMKGARIAPAAWVLTWKNPHPRERISEISLVCTSEPTPIALLGINTIEPTP